MPISPGLIISEHHQEHKVSGFSIQRLKRQSLGTNCNGTDRVNGRRQESMWQRDAGFQSCGQLLFSIMDSATSHLEISRKTVAQRQQVHQFIDEFPFSLTTLSDDQPLGRKQVEDR